MPDFTPAYPPNNSFDRVIAFVIRRFGQIRSFLETAKISMAEGESRIHVDSLASVTDLFSNPAYDDFFKDKVSLIAELGGKEEFADASARLQIERFSNTARAASLVFSHSVLDAVAFDLLRITAHEDPTCWHPHVKHKKLNVEDLLNDKGEEVIQNAIAKAVKDMEMQSLQKKIERLFSICQPSDQATTVQGFKYSSDRIDSLDRRRIDIVHGQGPEGPVQFSVSDLDDVQATCIHLCMSVNHRFGCKIDPTAFIKGLSGQDS